MANLNLRGGLVLAVFLWSLQGLASSVCVVAISHEGFTTSCDGGAEQTTVVDNTRREFLKSMSSALKTMADQGYLRESCFNDSSVSPVICIFTKP